MENISEPSSTRVIALFGFPDSWHVGLDMQMWQMTSKFHGLCNVPSGIHYVYYSDPNDWHRQGFFFVPDEENVTIHKWDARSESFLRVIDRTEYNTLVRRTREDMEVISGIVDFNQLSCVEDVSKWRGLSNFISAEVVSRIQPAGDRPIHNVSQPYRGAMSEAVPSLFWSPIGPLRLDTRLSPSEISAVHLDTTLHLNQFIQSTAYVDKDNSVLGEFQAAYLLFQLGQNYEAFLQYRKLLELFLGCSDEGVRNNSQLFSKFMQLVIPQIKEFPDDFLVEDSDNPVFILALLARFLDTCNEINLSLRNELGLEKLDKVIRAKFGDHCRQTALPLDDDPVVVEQD